MRIHRVTARNVLGLKDVTVECGLINEITGTNASGKTSILEAIRAALAGGNLMNLQNVHEEGEPETVLVIDDGKFLLERKGDSLTLKERVGDSAAYEKVKRPQAVINEWFDKDLSNPFRFLQAPQKERLGMFLEALHLDLPTERIKAAFSNGLAELWPTVEPIATKGGHPLQVLAQAHQALYAVRTGVNVSERDKRASAQEIRKAIPADMPDASPSAISTLEAERDQVAGRVTSTKARIESDHRQAVESAQAAHNQAKTAQEERFKASASRVRASSGERIGALQAEAQRKIQAIEAQLATDVAAEKEAAQAQVDKLNDAAFAEIDQAAEILKASRAEADGARHAQLQALATDEEQASTLAAQLAKLRAQAEESTRLVTLKNQAERFEAEAESLEGKALKLTSGMSALEALKVELLKDLPIDGLEVDDKDIRLNKVPFDQVNLSHQLELAADLVILRAKRFPLPVAFIDGFESFDKKHRAIVFKKFEKAGVQIFTSRVVDEGPREMKKSDTAEKLAASA